MPANEFTAILDVKPGERSRLDRLLKQIGNPLKQENGLLHFAPLDGRPARTHFARMVIIPGKDSPVVYPDAERPARLLFSAVFDGDARSFIREIDEASPRLREIFTHCRGYSGGDLFAYLRRYRHRPQIFYATFLNETVEGIKAKSGFRKVAQLKLDQFLPDRDAALDSIFQMARYPDAPPPNTAMRASVELIAAAIAVIAVAVAMVWITGQNRLVGTGLFLIAAALLAAVIVPALVTLFVVPFLESRFGLRPMGTMGAIQDQIEWYEEDESAYPASMVTGREDVIVQNQFNLYLTFKGNVIARMVRLLRMRLLMFVLHRTLRIWPTPGSLAGLTTVHFGHWLLIDGGRRLFFMTNYDGSWENYIADFVNKIHYLLDVQLWSFVGFGDEGTRNISAFRRWLRRVQVQSDVFYSGYPDTTVRNIIRDIEITRAFPSDRNDAAAVDAWLQLLADPMIRTPEDDAADTYRGRPPSTPALTKQDWGDIQSIIVYGYAHLPHGRYLFLHVEDPLLAKLWLSAVIPRLTTVAAWENDDPARTLQIALNLALTYPGAAALGVPAETLSTFSREFREGIAPAPKAAVDKLHPRSINLGDTDASAPEHWTVGNRPGQPASDEIHIMLLVNGRNAAAVDLFLETEPFSALSDSSAGLRIVQAEQGTTPSTGREPFGFSDGMSNPWIEGTRYSVRNADGSKGDPLRLTDTEIRKIEPDGQVRRVALDNDPVVRTGEFILGYMNEYGQLPATPMIFAEHDPAGRFRPLQDEFRDFGRNGSYLVYRKLTQDVERFWSYLADGALDADHTLKRAAKLVGRWPSGVPLTISGDTDDPALVQRAGDERNSSLLNNFRYRMEGADDSDGLRCPFGSHTRRSHPRDSLLDDTPWQSYRNANLHRILRRGATFGRLPDHATQHDYFARVGVPGDITYTEHPDHAPDPDGVGLHFLGINANIQQQFEFVQQAWGNNSRFNGMFNTKDPVTGNHAEYQPPADRMSDAGKYAEIRVDSTRLQTSSMTIPGADIHEHLSMLPRFVAVRGGAYLFLPSVTALQFIAEV